MNREERQKVYDNVEAVVVLIGIISLIVVIFAACNLYALSNEQIESPGSHFFHSIAASVGSLGCTFAGQIEGSIPLAVDAVTQAFDFFGASAKQAAHERSVSNTEDTLFWSTVFLVISGVVVFNHKKLEAGMESLLVALEITDGK